MRRFISFFLFLILYSQYLSADLTQTHYGSKDKVIKWNPGHYLRIGIHQKKQDLTNKQRQFEIIRNQPLIQGVQIPYRWHDLEYAKGKYDFSEIESDLAYLQSMGKRLIIQIQTTTFGDGSQVSPVPSYILKNPMYNGGVWIGNNIDHGSFGRKVIKTWVPAINEKLILFHKALGNRFNDEPFVEAVNTEETAVGKMSLLEEKFHGYTTAKFTEAYKRRLISLKAAFPNTVVIGFTNYLTLSNGYNKDDQTKFLESIMDTCYSIGIGVGGPDLIIPFAISSKKNDLMRTIPSYSLIEKRRDLLPKGMAVMWNSFRHASSEELYWTFDELIDYGVDILGLNYIFWQYVPIGKYEGASIYDAFKSINNKRGKINTVTPANLR